MILLVLLGLGLMLWANRSADYSLPEVLEKLPANVDLGLDNVHYSQNENGVTSWVLDADRAAYQRKEDELDLTGIKLTFFSAGRFGELKLNAARGILRRQQKQLDLAGNVRILAGSGENFASETLHYDFDRKIATTKDQVRMWDDRLELTGVGLNLDLVQGKIQILRNVHALYAESAAKGEPQ
jgi:LPS export ABC transporter protein LptC